MNRQPLRGKSGRLGNAPSAELAAAVEWITEQVVGGGMTDARLPSVLTPLVAQRMVDDPRCGWPDVESALSTLVAEHGVAEYERR